MGVPSARCSGDQVGAGSPSLPHGSCRFEGLLLFSTTDCRMQWLRRRVALLLCLLCCRDGGRTLRFICWEMLLLCKANHTSAPKSPRPNERASGAFRKLQPGFGCSEGPIEWFLDGSVWLLVVLFSLWQNRQLCLISDK